MSGFFPIGSSHTFFEKGRIHIESGLFVNRIFSVLHSAAAERHRVADCCPKPYPASVLTIGFKIPESEPFTPSLYAPLVEVFNFRSTVRIYY